jgi:hypothetical protein
MIAGRLAIDLSGDTVRMLAGSAGGHMKAAEGKVPASVMNDGVVLNSAALAPIIKELAAHVDGREGKAVIAASDSLASFRIVNVAKDATDAKIDSLVRAQLPLDGNRMGMQRVEVTSNGLERTVYAVAFDRLKVQGLAAAVRLAGLEPSVIELKSLCVARIAPAASCVVLDVTVSPAEVFLIDGSLPRLRHTFKVDLSNGAELGRQLAGGARAVLGFYKRLPGGSDYPPDAPVFISGEGSPSPLLVSAVQATIEHPVQALPAPPRIPPDIRYGPYLACLGLVMRRR